MKETMPAWPAAPSAFAGSDWFDPLEDAVRAQVRAFIEALLEEELEAALGRGRYERGASSNGRRHGHRPRQLVTTFGPLMLSVPLPVCATTLASRNGRALCCRPTSGSATAPKP